jgi:hypothetical protein
MGDEFIPIAFFRCASKVDAHMNFDAKAQQPIREYLKDPANSLNQRNLGALYWSIIQETLGKIIRENKGGPEEFLKKESDFVNFGLVPEVLEDAEQISRQIREGGAAYPHIKIDCAADWLTTTYERIRENDRRELLENDIRLADRQKHRCEKEIAQLQQSRRETFMDELASTADASTADLIDSLEAIDELAMGIMRSRRSIAKGQFFSVQERRDLVARENKLRDMTGRYDALMTRIKVDEKKKELKSIAEQLTEQFTKFLETEDSVAKMEKEIQEIQQKQQNISLIEVEARLNTEIEYIRDLVLLCARRLKGTSIAILRPKEPFFTFKELQNCLDNIMQFDPKIFRNDRANFFGKPSLLLIPGNGNALYDWKNNRFLVPLTPPGGNFMASIATAIIEYRLDVDEDKIIVTSYSKLPHLKKVRSILQIKGSLIKDYLTWMTSEARGYKLLPKETRQWFEHEIAPSKNDIYCPPELQQFNLTQEQFKQLFAEVEQRVGSQIDKADKSDLWRASILNYQQGKFERAWECIKAFIDKDSKHWFGLFNMGMIAMKVTRKTEAAKAFNDFCGINPQSWWTNIVRDHLRRMTMS